MGRLRNLGRATEGGTTSRARRLLMGLAATVAGVALLLVALYYVDVATESDAFCGTLCHANFPEYVANKVSVHAEVQCSECHIGPGVPAKVMAKVNGVGEMIAQIRNTFERPIEPPVEGMRSTDVICGQCHVPEDFHEYRVHYATFYAEDEQNSETRVYVRLRTAGESDSNPGQANVHWHVDNPVTYVSYDREAQEIPWVGVVKEGELVEYEPVGSLLAREDLAKMPRKKMDCLSCHSRPAHAFSNPERNVDAAIADGRLDDSLPYIKREALQLLTASYESRAEAWEAFAGLGDFYLSQYPEVFAAKELSIEQAVAELQIIYSYSVFPDMNVTWEAYADNIGHTDFPGCFRCHNGEQLNAQGEPIPADCDTCHFLEWL